MWTYFLQISNIIFPEAEETLMLVPANKYSLEYAERVGKNP